MNHNICHECSAHAQKVYCHACSKEINKKQRKPRKKKQKVQFKRPPKVESLWVRFDE